MVSTTQQRMVTLTDGKRVPIKLDAPTWQAVEWLAEHRSTTWAELCADVLASTPDADNMTATIREAAMSGLLEETVFADRAAQIAAMEMHPLMRNSGLLNDAQLNKILKTARVAGQSDFGGFTVIFGLDEYAQDCIWIKNGLRDGMHFAFVVPIEQGAGA